jgi:hypothetical protein
MQLAEGLASDDTTGLVEIWDLNSRKCIDTIYAEPGYRDVSGHRVYYKRRTIRGVRCWGNRPHRPKNRHNHQRCRYL